VKPLRHLFLVLLLCAGQWLAAAHAVEHGLSGKAEPGLHTCQLCLAGHDLGAALPSLPPTLPAAGVEAPPTVPVAAGRSDFPPPSPAQRDPPSA